MEGLTEGRIVHYVLEGGLSEGIHRPAIVVNDWKNGSVNLQVFLDGLNDGFIDMLVAPVNIRWRTNIHYSETKEPGTWHWIESATNES